MFIAIHESKRKGGGFKGGEKEGNTILEFECHGLFSTSNLRCRRHIIFECFYFHFLFLFFFQIFFLLQIEVPNRIQIVVVYDNNKSNILRNTIKKNKK